MEVIDYIVKIASNNIFPIVCCWMLFRENCEERKSHIAESDALKQCFMEITVAITRLVDKIDFLLDLKGGHQDG